MTKAVEIVNSLLCDYVGQGHANKHILVNVIGGDVIVGEMPTEVSFGFYFEFMFREIGQTELTIEALIGGNKLFALGSTASATEVPGTAIIVIPMVPIRIESDVDLEVYASGKKFKRTQIMKRRIFKGDLSSAFRPPSVQSQPAAPETPSQP